MNQSVGPVSLKSISDNQGISLSYLELLFSKLRRQGLVVGARGPGGGYLLAREIESINIADIILAVDEPLDVTECEGEENCQDGRRCLAHDLWSELSEQLHLFLSGIHLDELMARNQRQITGPSCLKRRDSQRVEMPGPK